MITRIEVSGFKSLYTPQAIDIKPLTILAGANSSGKSSIIQPLLLMKQTLYSPFSSDDALLLNGTNVKFTSVDQIFSKNQSTFTITLTLTEDVKIYFNFGKNEDNSLHMEPLVTEIANENLNFANSKNKLKTSSYEEFDLTTLLSPLNLLFANFDPIHRLIMQLLHLRGLRNPPERTYPLTKIDSSSKGVFNNYVAGVILNWQRKQPKNIEKLNEYLIWLGLTSHVAAKRLNEAHLELEVATSLQDPDNKVNIADAGFGVSQVLPVIVALMMAEPEQLVYLEQPEIHLHPRIQYKLAKIIADAAQRGVRVIVETHSSLLLLGVQTLVAEGKLSPDLVKLHWFQRDMTTGATTITGADLDEMGAFGEEFPEDFDDVTLKADRAYLDAVEKKSFLL
jgi:predicted ATPase